MDNLQNAEPVVEMQEAPKRKPFWKNTRGIALFVAFVLIFSCIGGYTLAYLKMDKEDTVDNKFELANVLVKLAYDEPKTDGSIKTFADVHVENEGNIAAYIRVAVIVNWSKSETENGNIKITEVYAGSKPELDNDYHLEGFNESDWHKIVDADSGICYYYYRKPVNPKGATGNGTTNNLFTTCKMNSSGAPEGYVCSVEFAVQAIQAVGGFVNNGDYNNITPAVVEAWGSDVASVNADGSLSFNK